MDQSTNTGHDHLFTRQPNDIIELSITRITFKNPR